MGGGCCTKLWGEEKKNRKKINVIIFVWGGEIQGRILEWGVGGRGEGVEVGLLHEVEWELFAAFFFF